MNTYNPYGYNNPYMAQNTLSNAFSNARQEITRVNGKNGVDAFQMPPNSSVLLLDTSAPIVWLCVTDGAGYKTSTPYSITPYQEAKPEDVYAGLEERIRKIEERLNEQSDVIGSEQKRSTAKSRTD